MHQPRHMFGKGISVGRLLGIRIRLDWSLIIVFLLVAFNLGAGVFPAWHPEWSALACWAVALAAAVLFFVSILIHELSHSLVARAYGIPVDGITLFLFGGVANIEHDPESPKAEALMAGIGPIVSIGLGVGFAVLGGLIADLPPGAAEDPVRAFQQMGPIATLLTWLGPINVIVGVFNLLPGFPLDGGRVTRAILWGVTGDLTKATRWASRIGQGLAWTLIALGLAMALGMYVPFFGTGLVAGLWLAFIGWFLNGAAVSSYRQVLLRRALEGTPVSRVMRRRLPTLVDAELSITELVRRHSLRADERLFLVVAGSTLVGAVRPRDARRVSRSRWSTTRIGAIALPYASVARIHPEHDAFDAMRQLGRSGAELMFVMDHDERLVGVLQPEDIVRWLDQENDAALRRSHPGAFRPSSTDAG